MSKTEFLPGSLQVDMLDIEKAGKDISFGNLFFTMTIQKRTTEEYCR